METLFFDFFIALLIITGALVGILILRHRYLHNDTWEYQHPRISEIMAVILFLGAATVIYGSFFEPNRLVVIREKIDLPGISKPIKIAIFSDIQVGPYKQEDDLRALVEKILRLKPDLAFVVGDLINNGSTEKDEIEMLNPLAALALRIPTFSVNGNHEYGVNRDIADEPAHYFFPDKTKEIALKMKKLGVRHLVNETKLIKVRDQSFYLFGGDEWWTDQLNFSSLSKRQGNLATIALIHNPASAREVEKQNINLMISGHTHGGQIQLPFIGPLARVDDVTPKKWYRGFTNFENMTLFVTSGAGETGARARLFIPPEIVLLTIY